MTPDATIAVRVQPRASRTEIKGERDGAIVVRVTAAPVDNKANEAVCKLIAARAGVARNRVRIVRGGSGRTKTVRVEGMSEPELRSALGA